VEFVKDGRAKHPVVPYDQINIQLPLRETTEKGAASA
jgi:predicted transcriptional regulator